MKDTSRFIYEGDELIATCDSREQASRIVRLLESAEGLREALIFAKADLMATVLEAKDNAGNAYWIKQVCAVQDAIDAALAATRALLKSAGHDPDHPHFEVEEAVTVRSQGRCVHTAFGQGGIVLDTVNRSVRCRMCGAVIDAFDALVQYARDARFASYQEQQESQRAVRENQQKARQKVNRPFIREVAHVEPVKDHALKVEPVIGHALTLTCGHVVNVGVDGITKTRTCGECARDAKIQNRDPP